MKKRNKKYLQEKDFIRLKKAEVVNYTAQRNLGWVELEKPIHDGFTAKLKLRDDVANRQDAWVFQNILDNFGTESFARKLSDFRFNDRKKRWLDPNTYRRPHISEISEHTYLNLSTQEQKYFANSILGYGWHASYYYCTVPDFFYEVVYEKHFRTKAQITDEILLQEEAEIEGEIFRNHFKKTCDDGYRKNYGANRKHRANSKTVLHNIMYEKSRDEFVSNYKKYFWSDRWYW